MRKSFKNFFRENLKSKALKKLDVEEFLVKLNIFSYYKCKLVEAIKKQLAVNFLYKLKIFNS